MGNVSRKKEKLPTSLPLKLPSSRLTPKPLPCEQAEPLWKPVLQPRLHLGTCVEVPTKALKGG